MVRTVVLPVAGMGTRMLPATRSVPKELLPVYDTPMIQFAIDEAVAAGAERIVLVTHPSKTELDEYVKRPVTLERSLRERGKTAELAELCRVTLDDRVEVVTVTQEEQRGLGHAVLMARDVTGGDPFGVILPDDLLLGGTCLGAMAEAYHAAPDCRSLIGAMAVPPAQVSRYGIFSFAEMGSRDGTILPARGLVEKPDPADAPSDMAAIGRYILPHEIFEELARTRPGQGAEIQLTDAIDALGGLAAFPITEPRFDCGSKEGLFEASRAVREARIQTTGELHIAAE